MLVEVTNNRVDFLVTLGIKLINKCVFIIHLVFRDWTVFRRKYPEGTMAQAIEDVIMRKKTAAAAAAAYKINPKSLHSALARWRRQMPKNAVPTT